MISVTNCMCMLASLHRSKIVEMCIRSLNYLGTCPGHLGRAVHSLGYERRGWSRRPASQPLLGRFVGDTHCPSDTCNYVILKAVMVGGRDVAQ